MSINLLLVCKEGEARQAYLDAIRALDVHVDTVSSFTEARKTMMDTPFNGVVVDVLTKIKAPKDEKILMHEVLEEFPVIQLRWEAKEAMIKTLYFGQIKSSGTLEDFVNEACRFFDPRKIRTNTRKPVNLNVILAKHGDVRGKDVERSVTIDVSDGGCFIYSSDKWKEHSRVWLVIKELEDDTIIQGEVRWAVKWGEAMRIPGIGVMFKDIKKNQHEDFCNRCGI